MCKNYFKLFLFAIFISIISTPMLITLFFGCTNNTENINPSDNNGESKSNPENGQDNLPTSGGVTEVTKVIEESKSNQLVMPTESPAGEENPPVVFKVSEGIKPGALISLYGEYMKGNVKVKFIETGEEATPVQTDKAGQFIRILMPEDIAPGAYTLQVSNDDGATWGNPVYLNQASPGWLSDVKGYPGLQMKLIGRNFYAGEYDGVKNTEIRLVPVDGGASFNATVDILTPNAVTFTISEETAIGNYYVEVKTNSAGLGRNWVRHSETLNVTNAPTDPLALALKVGWTDVFKWSNVHNVKDEFGAAGDGSANDTANIQKAINEISAQGGGIVYFPSGTYNYTHINMTAGVILKGESVDNTTLNYVGKGLDTFITTKGAGLTEGNLGIANLKLTVDLSGFKPEALEYKNGPKVLKLGKDWPDNISNNGADWRDYGQITSENIFLYNVFIDIPLDTYFNREAIMIGSRNRTLIAECHFINAPFFSAYLIDHAIFRDNTVELSHDCIEMNGSKLIAENNTLIGYRNMPTSDELHGFFINPAFGYYIEGAYYYNNTVTGMGNIGNKNNGEAFCMDGNGSFMAGQVSAASSNSVTFHKDVVSVSEHDWTIEKFWVCIVSGKGLGQLIKIESYSDNGGGSYTLTLAEPWAVTPDSTSVVSVMRFVNNAVFEQNTITDCSTGIQSWMSAYDVVIADNKITDTNSHWHCGRILGPSHTWCSGAEPTMFVTTKRTVTSGAAANFLENNWIGISSEQSECGTTDAYITTAYGCEFRNNTIDRKGFSGKCDSYSTVAAAMPLVYNATKPDSGRGIVAALFEGNTVKNSDNGVWIDYAVDGTIVYGNTFIGITKEAVHDDGQNTVILNNKDDSGS